ncbi:hypothetical protein ACH5RR_032822 [Cinchona calisaya]|uniref:Bromo domain-containing protein n=1 Tax=Cinchona calisaya TaxID=153742 RepID=A0ABD2YJ73_9GENT
MSYNSLHANSDRKSCEIGSHTKVQILNGFNKRKAQLVLDGKKEKRQRMDPRVKRQCGVILEALITHPYAWVFRTPVDPVVWNIPDYFSIISDPMDLGTVKSKLAGNRYFTAEEFAFDVKLTFSNAMLYNPPDHDVHVMAKQLQCIFIRRWKLIDAKLKSMTASAQQGMISCGKSMPLEEKQKLRKDLLEMLKRKMNGKLCTVLQKFGFFGIRKEKIDLDIDALDDGILWELKRVLKDSSHASSSKHNKDKILPTKMQTQDHGCKSLSTSARRLDLVSGCQLTDSSRSGLHEENTCPSSRLSRTVTTAISAERSTCPIDDKEALKKDKILPTQMKIQDHERVHLSTSARRLDLVSDCHLTEDSGSGLDKENTCRSSGISTTALKRALRDAMLRSHFEEIISKANGGKADVQERMKRLQHEEEAFKARIREQQLKEEDELRRQTEKEREAARIALQMMERTIEFEDNLTTLKELEMLSQCAPTYIFHGCEPVMVFRTLKTGKVFNPLEQLGLHIKEELMADEEEEIVLGWEGEEGEILE